MNHHHASRSPVAAREALAPYRLLASRVIGLAMRDLMTCGRTSEDGNSARAFLSGSPMFTHWCEVAELDPAVVRARVRRVVAQRPFAPVPESED